MTAQIPDLIPLYKEYLDAFNRQSLEDVLSLLGPDIHATFKGTPIPDSLNGPVSAYEKDFRERDKATPVLLEEIKQIERGSDGARGVYTRLLDQHSGKTLVINYWYQEYEGKWKHTWHEILSADKVV